MDKIAFPYRSPSHLPMLHVIGEIGAWEKYDLDVDYDRKISSSEAHERVTSGDIEFVGGNHVSTYGRRARGDDWIYLGQTMSQVPGWQLVVRADSGINSVADLRHKVVGGMGEHPGLNDWLFLKQHGLDVDRDDVQTIKVDVEPWEAVRDKKVDAAFIWPPATVFAKNAGLKLIEIDQLPMIFFTTISTSLRFAEHHPDLVERFLKGMMEGIAFFKAEPQKAIDIIRRRYTNEGVLDEEAATALHHAIADALDPKLYPRPEAIANVYQEGIRQDKDAAKINPMELWDLHFIRRLDDAGFLSRLTAAAR